MAKTISKALIGMEDLALGNGSQQQYRGGVAVPVSELNLPWVYNTTEAISVAPVIGIELLYYKTTTSLGVYEYRPDSFEAEDEEVFIDSIYGGQWVRLQDLLNPAGNDGVAPSWFHTAASTIQLSTTHHNRYVALSAPGASATLFSDATTSLFDNGSVFGVYADGNNITVFKGEAEWQLQGFVDDTETSFVLPAGKFVTFSLKGSAGGPSNTWVMEHSAGSTGSGDSDFTGYSGSVLWSILDYNISAIDAGALIRVDYDGTVNLPALDVMDNGTVVSFMLTDNLTPALGNVALNEGPWTVHYPADMGTGRLGLYNAGDRVQITFIGNTDAYISLAQSAIGSLYAVNFDILGDSAVVKGYNNGGAGFELTGAMFGDNLLIASDIQDDSTDNLRAVVGGGGGNSILFKADDDTEDLTTKTQFTDKNGLARLEVSDAGVKLDDELLAVGFSGIGIFGSGDLQYDVTSADNGRLIRVQSLLNSVVVDFTPRTGTDGLTIPIGAKFTFVLESVLHPQAEVVVVTGNSWTFKDALGNVVTTLGLTRQGDMATCVRTSETEITIYSIARTVSPERVLAQNGAHVRGPQYHAFSKAEYQTHEFDILSVVGANALSVFTVSDSAGSGSVKHPGLDSVPRTATTVVLKVVFEFLADLNSHYVWDLRQSVPKDNAGIDDVSADKLNTVPFLGTGVTQTLHATVDCFAARDDGGMQLGCQLIYQAGTTGLTKNSVNVAVLGYYD